jgi:hypothetical protein
VRDVSPGGAGLLLDRGLAPGTDIVLDLRGPSTRVSFALSARVAHATPQPGGSWLTGCTFQRPPPPLLLSLLL